MRLCFCISLPDVISKIRAETEDLIVLQASVVYCWSGFFALIVSFLSFPLNFKDFSP